MLRMALQAGIDDARSRRAGVRATRRFAGRSSSAAPCAGPAFSARATQGSCRTARRWPPPRFARTAPARSVPRCRPTTAAPPIMSEWPLTIFRRRVDDDDRTRRVSGPLTIRAWRTCCRSPTEAARRLASSTTAARSTSFSSGFEGLSTQIIRVLGRMAASNAGRSVGSR